MIKDYGQLSLVTCYASQINQVFMHLLNNANDAFMRKVVIARTTQNRRNTRSRITKDENRLSLAHSYKKNCASAKAPLNQGVSVSLILLSLSGCILPVLSPQLVSAQTSTTPPSCLEPSAIAQLEQGVPSRGGDIVTANIISQTKITTPSFWWAEEQFDEFGGKLLTNWIAYQEEKRIDLVVNRQPWTLLNYLERYGFVNKFGTVARDYNYNVRVCNQQAVLLATYTCDYSKTLPDCRLTIFDSFGQDSLPVQRQ